MSAIKRATLPRFAATSCRPAAPMRPRSSGSPNKRTTASANSRASATCTAAPWANSNRAMSLPLV